MSKLRTACHFPSKMSCDSLVLLGPCVHREQVGRLKKLNARAEHHVEMLSLKDQRRSAVRIPAVIELVGSQPHSTSNCCAWLSPQEEASSEDDTQ